MKKLHVHNHIIRWRFIASYCAILIIPSIIAAQGKINIGVGADLLEYYNISFRYQGDQTQYALGIGALRNEYENRLSISTSFYYHFDGTSILTSRRPWYGKITINYNKYDNDYLYSEPDNLSAGLRVGRDFNLSKKLAINSDIGFSIGRIGGVSFYPTTGIWLFYRI